MKRHIFITLLLLATHIMLPADQLSIPLDPYIRKIHIKKDDTGRFHRISLYQAVENNEKPGWPDIPYLRITKNLPAEAKNIKAFLADAEYQEVPGPITLAPACPDRPLNGSLPPAVEMDSLAYRFSKPMPLDPMIVERISARGESLQVSIRLSPAKYFPTSGRLEILTAGRIAIDYRPDPIHRNWAENLRSRHDNPISVEFGKSADYWSSYFDNASGRTLGTMPADSFEYLIITNQDMAEAFSKLAAWRSRRGLRSQVETVEWIAGHIPGADLAERVRQYIKACWLYCGTRYVLLGGDIEIIPVRNVFYVDSYLPDNQLPSDLYYADIIDTTFAQGFWGYNYNANGNQAHGELPGNCGQDDGIDQTPDLYVGRAPVKDPVQADRFVSKIMAYESGPEGQFGQEALFMSDGNFAWFLEYADQAVASLAPWVQTHKMYNPVSGGYYSGDEVLTVANGLQQMNYGYNIVYHFDHGGYYTLSLAKDHASLGGGWIYRPQVQALCNQNRAGIFLTPACSPNALDYQSLAEELINNPQGGSAAFIGNTRVGWTSQYGQFQRFFTSLYGQNLRMLGQIFSEMQNSGNAYGRYALNLLGDPAMPVWARAPQDLMVQITRTAQGQDSLIAVSVGAGAYGPAAATVVLTQKGRIVSRQDISLPSTVCFFFRDLPKGWIDISVSALDHRPYMDSLLVTAGSQALIDGFKIDDLSSWAQGNGDGRANPGETIFLVPGLEPKEIRWAHLVSQHPAVSVIDSIIVPLSVSASARRPGFLLKIDPQIHDDLRAWLRLDILLGQRNDTISYPLALDISADSLAIAHAAYRLDTISGFLRRLALDSLILANYGNGAARGVTARLSFGPTPNVISDEAVSSFHFGDIPSGSVSRAGRLCLFLPSGFSDQDSLYLVLEDHYRRTRVKRFALRPPIGRPYALSARPLSSRSLRLEWRCDDSAAVGFNIYSLDGSNIRLNPMPIKLRYFVLEGLEPLMPRRYAVAAVGASGVEGEISEAIVAAAAPGLRPGFPASLGMGNTGTRIWGNPASGDINGDGREEIVMGSDDGRVYVFDDRGNILPGWPQDLGLNPYGRKIAIENSSPTLADLDGDGLLDIVMGNGPWYGDVGDGLVHAWRHDGSELPGWPQPVYGDAFAPVAVADLDGDSLPEVVTTTTLGRVYLWNHQGQLLPGWPVTAGNTRIMAGAALGDLDGDGIKEIVVSTNHSGWLRVHALKVDGTNLAGWPRDLQTGACHVLSTPALADMDGDGSLEVVLASEKDASGVSYVYCLRADGTNLEGWPHALAFSPTLSSPALGDLDGDGLPEIALVSGDRNLYSLSHRGGPAVNWSAGVPPNGRSSPVIGDIDGDGIPDVLAAAEDGYLRAFHGATGQMMPGFPLWIEPSWSAPLLSDFDGDGSLDLAAFGWGSHRLYSWSLSNSGRAQSVEWGRLGGDMGRTGCYHRTSERLPVYASSGRASMPSSVFSFSMENCRPNPFRERTTINFQLARTDEAEIRIYNSLGQLVRSLSLGMLPAGNHRIIWDGCDGRGRRVSSGAYFCRLSSGSETRTKKMVRLD